MLKKLRILALLIPCAVMHAQTCTTAVCNAASASESAVLAALPSSSNTHASVVVNIPTSTATWTTTFSYTVPAAVTSLTIQGNTAVTCTGTAGSSGYSCSVTDNTIINDDVTNSSTPLWVINVGNASTLFRITGITLQPLNSGVTAKSQGMVQFTGNTTNFRWDHSHISVSNSDNAGPEFDGQIEGVVDHNKFSCGTNGSFTNCIRFYNDLLDSVGNGDGGWMAATQWGSQHAIFVEANDVSGGFTTDCGTAGREVVRYNTLTNMQNASGALHSVKDPGGAERGCRSEEFYRNYLSGATPATVFAATGGEGSSLIEWGNTLTNVSVSFFYAGGLWRSESVQVPNEPSGKLPPNGWAMCGTNMDYPGTPGTVSGWDGNSNTGTGYPCLDGLGRGQQQQGMNGANFPSRVNTVTGTQAWPHQYLEPIYLWMNTLPSGLGGEVQLQDASTTVNKDLYYDCNSYNSSCSTFTGAHGTGFGLLSSRPSTCTAGPGGTFYGSPTGSYGVAYWATDANSGNGELYVCTATNVWTGIYQPYTYPHPLATSGTLPPTYSPTGGTYSSSQTITVTCPSSGSVCFCTTDGSVPTLASTQYTNGSHISIATTTTLQCKAAVPIVNQLESQNNNPSSPGTFWKPVDTLANDDPGGTGTPTATAHTSGNTSPSPDGQPTMLFSETPQASHQTNALWPVTTSYGPYGDYTHIYARFQIYITPTNASGMSSAETDNWIFDAGDGIRWMYGAQNCRTASSCPSGKAGWDFGGNSNVPWTYSGINSVLPAGAWTSVGFLLHRDLSEVTSKPCIDSSGNHWPYLYYDGLVLNGVNNTNGGAGWKFCANALPATWGSGSGPQFQIDASSTASPAPVSFYVTHIDFLETEPPSTTTSATYTITTPPLNGPTNFSGKIQFEGQVKLQ